MILSSIQLNYHETKIIIPFTQNTSHTGLQLTAATHNSSVLLHFFPFSHWSGTYNQNSIQTDLKPTIDCPKQLTFSLHCTFLPTDSAPLMRCCPKTLFNADFNIQKKCCVATITKPSLHKMHTWPVTRGFPFLNRPHVQIKS